MNLTHDAMLVSLRINSWSGRLYDRQASQQVAVHNDADTGAGRYNKRLLPKQAFAALAATMSNARTSHNANTLPWDDQGGRPPAFLPPSDADGSWLINLEDCPRLCRWCRRCRTDHLLH